jgi:hypothetical protein
MTTANPGSWCVTVGAFVILVAAAITGCRTCPFGQDIVIPSSDVTGPSLVMDLHMPNGSIVTVTPGYTTSTVPVPGGGKVTVTVNAKDAQGVKDAQIWAARITTTIDPNTGLATRSGSGLLGRPTASNADSGLPGQKGCTERVVSQNLKVSRTPQRVVSYKVTAHGVNFGSRDVRTPTVTLRAQ